MMNLSNPTELKLLLNRHGFSFSKSLGQNFLIDADILSKIVSAAEINENDYVLEIGPGAGTLTQYLADNCKKVVAVEIDKALLPILNDSMNGYDNFKLINADIMKTDIKSLAESEFDKKPFHVVANLPYYITTPIVMKLFEERLPVKSMTLMVQKEVAERMCAKSGGKDYGALSVAVQYHSYAKCVCTAQPHCFIPNPKVASCVVNLQIPDEKPFTVNDEKKFFAIVKSAFGQRRKTLVNALLKSPYIHLEKNDILSALKSLDLDENIRGEKLSISEFARLSDIL